ncbi:hypothetical protein [Paenibacillus typhae]|uniref:Uncharacterized protein n=1 Tax=Paenibacillus typhae TaxID=1174501 RepID=A0A1G9GC75_9BACL|nr:hypothetical protein [Paenibacillus typhae]SDK98344.1 hypothetical protein SAMN05216192_1645 [Paenibacillus typhae]
MRKVFLILLCISLITGCSKEHSSSYPSSVAINNNMYGLSNTTLKIQDIGEEIGPIEKITHPMPTKNGESNEVPVGSTLYMINGVNMDEAIAVKVDEEYYKATKNGPLSSK